MNAKLRRLAEIEERLTAVVGPIERRKQAELWKRLFRAMTDSELNHIHEVAKKHAERTGDDPTHVCRAVCESTPEVVEWRRIMERVHGRIALADRLGDSAVFERLRKEAEAEIGGPYAPVPGDFKPELPYTERYDHWIKERDRRISAAHEAKLRAWAEGAPESSRATP